MMKQKFFMGAFAAVGLGLGLVAYNGGTGLRAQDAPSAGGAEIKSAVCTGLKACKAKGEKECEKVVFSFAQTYCGGPNPGEGLGEYKQYVEIACPIAQRCKPDGFGSAVYCKQAIPLLNKVCTE